MRAFQQTYDEGMPHDLKLGPYWQPDQWDISKSHPLRGAGLTSEWSLQRTYACSTLAWRVRPYPHATELLTRLHALGVRIVFATAPRRTNPEWCYHREHACAALCRAAGIPEAPVVFTRDKTLVTANLLIDDCAANVREFEATGRNAWLFDQPYNRDQTVRRRVSAQDLIDAVQKAVDLWPYSVHTDLL